jgi:hypothetical protein
MLYTAPAILLLAVKIFATTWGARLLRPISPDRIGSWVTSWVIVQAILFVVMLLASAFNILDAVTIWATVIIGTAAVLLPGRRCKPLGVADIARQGGIGPWLFAVLLATLAARAMIFSDFSWDAQTHGIVRNAVWMNYHSILVHMPTLYTKIFTNEWNGELISLMYGLVSYNIQGLTFGNIEVLIACYVAYCWLALRLGAPPAWAAMVGLVMATAPAVLGLVAAFKGDLLSCGALAMTLGWLMVLSTPSNRAMAVAMLPTCGALAFGAKVTTLPLLLIIGIVAVALVVRSSYNRRLIVPTGVAVAGAAVFLDRFGLNAIVYGDPLQRIPQESPVVGWSTFADNIEPLTHQMLWFGVHTQGVPQYTSILAGGLGLTGFLALVVLVVQWSKGITPGRERLLILAGVVAAVTTTSWMIPWADWTFRYYLASVIVGLVAVVSFPVDRLAIWARSAVVGLSLLTAFMNTYWFTRPGEANGNRSIGDAIRLTINATPLDRALLAQQTITDSFRTGLPDFDRNTPLTFAVLQGIDAPISPLVGSRAQNRLFLAANVEGLARLTRSRHPDFVVITKRSNNPMNQQTRALFAGLGYKWLAERNLAAIARRDPDVPAQ